MTNYRVLIQEGHESERRQQELTDGIRRIAVDTFGDVPNAMPVWWHVVPKGFGWTGGKSSTSVVVFYDVPDDIAYESRVAILNGITNLWVEQTGIDPNEILVLP